MQWDRMVDYTITGLRYYLLAAGVFSFVVGIILLLNAKIVANVNNGLNKMFSFEKFIEYLDKFHTSFDLWVISRAKPVGIFFIIVAILFILAALPAVCVK